MSVEDTEKEASIQAQYYDGLSTRPIQVEVLAQLGELNFFHQGVPQQFTKGQFEVFEPMKGQPYAIDLHGGGRLLLNQSPATTAWLKVLGHRDNFVHRIVHKGLKFWGFCLSLLVVFALALVFGLPKVSQFLAEYVPVRYLENIDEQVVAMFERRLDASKIPEAKQAHIREMFEKNLVALKQQPGFENLDEHQFELRFYRMEDQINAFALPGGTIVLLDGIVQHASEEELLGVLFHEVAHVVERHSAEMIAREAVLGLVLGFAVGDFSAIGVVAFDLFSTFKLSRTAETQADGYAVRAFHALDKSVTPLVSFHEKLALMYRLEEADQENEKPAWTEYLSTHPSDTQRIEEIKRLWGQLKHKTD